MLVRCIDNSKCEAFLTLGKEYTLYETINHKYCISLYKIIADDGTPAYCNQDMFELVED